MPGWDRPNEDDGTERPKTPEQRAREADAAWERNRYGPDGSDRADIAARAAKDAGRWDRESEPPNEAETAEAARLEAERTAHKADEPGESGEASQAGQAGETASDGDATPETGHSGTEDERDATRSDDKAPAETQQEHGDAERLHRFGNKELPRPVRWDKDLRVDSPNEIIGPFEPTGPKDEDVKGASTYLDPHHSDVDLSGQYHRLPADYDVPDGLGVHADGQDAGGIRPWGHRTIYPTEAMTAEEFARRVADLPWEYVGKKKESKGDQP